MDMLYIASFLISTLIINAIAGKKALYYFLILVLIGVVIFRFNKYSISIDTPTILKDTTTKMYETSNVMSQGLSSKIGSFVNNVTKPAIKIER